MIAQTMDLPRLQALACAGDADAQAELIREFYPRVRAQVHRELERDFRRQHKWILPLFSTGDIVQEVLINVVQSLDAVDATEEDAFSRYLSTLVKHRLIDALRHHEASRRDARRLADAPEELDRDRRLAGEDPSPSSCASLTEQLDTFRDVLTSFSSREQSLLELRLLEDAEFADIASKLGFGSPDAARKAFNQLRARLVIRLRARGVHSPTLGS